jgi:hypothetical protein
MSLNDMTIIVPEDLIERIDRLEYKLDLLLSNKDFSNKNEKKKLIDGDEYVNEAKAAEMLNIKRPTLSSWKSRGLIPFYKPEWSNKSFYKVKDIIAIQTGVKQYSNKETESKAKTYLTKNKK